MTFDELASHTLERRVNWATLVELIEQAPRVMACFTTQGGDGAPCVRAIAVDKREALRMAYAARDARSGAERIRVFASPEFLYFGS